ncbi:hypothetical protein fugu_019089 [Takifugu bimaculatus]|uniref:Alpha-2B adrenergic receptor n=1 Tax=Takifugu bimaculatus TaxID=433685 RepID=A0A4Z2BJY5_9TELE|nr:hypothetical protein fugu_019089 [Takifugu bimaculatus]
MAAALDTPCLSDLGGLPNRNASLTSGVQPCNRSTARIPPYSPQATASIAIAITFMMMLTIVGNILVIIAVLTSRSLKGAQNLFLVSLAAADILVATLIIPFSLANELQGYWAFSSIWCEIYLALDVLFCTSSIVHLCAIALDRYLSISQPCVLWSQAHAGTHQGGHHCGLDDLCSHFFPPSSYLGQERRRRGGVRAEQRALVHSLLHHRLLLRPLRDYDSGVYTDLPDCQAAHALPARTERKNGSREKREHGDV